MTAIDSFREDERLAVYGSLQPGGSNEHVLSELAGIWAVGTVRGELMQEGWGATQGYPGIRLSPNAGRVPVHIFCSHDLPSRWAVLDEFEGPEYRRTTVVVRSAVGDFAAQIYEVDPGEG